jgi:predicted nuclease with TOPRIM domain
MTTELETLAEIIGDLSEEIALCDLAIGFFNKNGIPSKAAEFKKRKDDAQSNLLKELNEYKELLDRLDNPDKFERLKKYLEERFQWLEKERHRLQQLAGDLHPGADSNETL